jgi:hypothetical protein
LINAVCAAYSLLQSSRIQARRKPFHDWFRPELRGLTDQQLLRLSVDRNNDWTFAISQVNPNWAMTCFRV